MSIKLQVFSVGSVALVYDKNCSVKINYYTIKRLLEISFLYLLK